ncbi:MAG: hypothetical protein LC097_02775 [Burkholderiales bacterium]|nr:hypothetical protein [Burkholderiales bacterium]
MTKALYTGVRAAGAKHLSAMGEGQGPGLRNEGDAGQWAGLHWGQARRAAMEGAVRAAGTGLAGTNARTRQLCKQS